MSVLARFSYAQTGNIVPYPPCYEGGRTNGGFVDLRGQPELVETIHEAQESCALIDFLKQLAGGHDWISLGCDLGTREEDGRRSRCWAGGYVQFTSTVLEADYDNYKTVGEGIYGELEDVADGECWRLSFEVGEVCYKLEDEEQEVASLWIWFDAAASSEGAAKLSRERLISVIAKALYEYSK